MMNPSKLLREPELAPQTGCGPARKREPRASFRGSVNRDSNLIQAVPRTV